MDSVHSTNKVPVFYGYIIVTAAVLIMVIAWGTNYSFGIFFTPLLREFGWTRAVTSGAFSLAMLLEGFGGMFLGRINDRLGARLVMTVCGLGLGIGYLLMSRVTQIWHLYVFYGLLVGLGLSGTYVTLTSTVTRWFVKRRGLMVGIVSAGMGMGTLLMTPLANRLIQAFGWRTSYVLVGVMAILLIVVAAQFLRNPEAEKGHGLNSSDGPLDAGAVKIDSVSFRAAIRTRQIWLLCSILFCWGAVSLIIVVHIVPHAIELGFSAGQAAGVLALIGGIVFIAKIMFGITTDMIGSKRAFIIGLILMFAGLIWLLTTRELGALYLFAFFYAFGYACGSVVMPTIVAEIFGLGSHGVLLGVVNFSACVGAAVGPIMAGALFDLRGDYALAFLVTTGLSLISLVMALGLRTDGRQIRKG